jgi:hypothetical protein
MTVKSTLLGLAVSLLATRGAIAHPDHDHPRKGAPTAPTAAIEEDAAKARAQEELVRLVSVKKIDPSWKDAGRLGTIKKVGDTKSWEWLVTFDNDKVKENKRLYVYLKPSGEFVAANFTGK